MSKFKAGDVVRHKMESSDWSWVVTGTGTSQWGEPIAKIKLLATVKVGGYTYEKGLESTSIADLLKFVKPPKQRKSSKSLYLASDAKGVTIKGLVNVINNRKVDTFGNSPLQALSKYEDKYGRKLTQENGVIWKLVPYKMRQDKNGKVRVGREIK